MHDRVNRARDIHPRGIRPASAIVLVLLVVQVDVVEFAGEDALRDAIVAVWIELVVEFRCKDVEHAISERDPFVIGLVNREEVVVRCREVVDDVPDDARSGVEQRVRLREDVPVETVDELPHCHIRLVGLDKGSVDHDRLEDFVADVPQPPTVSLKETVVDGRLKLRIRLRS